MGNAKPPADFILADSSIVLIGNPIIKAKIKIFGNVGCFASDLFHRCSAFKVK
jgi:hypothetical protein